jgi:hypothetical protein
MAGYVNEIPVRLIDEVEMENSRDWPSRLLEMIPVKGTLAKRLSISHLHLPPFTTGVILGEASPV